MEKDSKILVTGCQGMTGGAVVKELNKQGYKNIIRITRADCDLTNQQDVKELFKKECPEYVFHIAAKVGGSKVEGDQSGKYIYENLMMQCNVIEMARLFNIKKLLFCSTIYVYPKTAQSPIKETELLKGDLFDISIGYSIAKLTGIYMTKIYSKQYGCDFISVIPPNIYGPGDNFNLQTGRVISALIHKFNDAKINKFSSVTILGTGKSIREFIYVDDLAKGMLYLMNTYSDPEPINIGTGIGVKITDLVEIIKRVTCYTGNIIWETDSEGNERRLDSTKINKLGWQAEVNLFEGIQRTYNWFINNNQFARK